MNKKADMLFGEIMRKARSERKITQEQLAEAVEISVTYCRYIEKGKYTCSWTIWLRICRRLGLDPYEIYDACFKELHKQ